MSQAVYIGSYVGFLLLAVGLVYFLLVRHEGKSDFGTLRVWVVKDGGCFFCQSLEVDYAAQGDTVEEAIRNFRRGLQLTVDLHLKRYGHGHKLIQPAPTESWKEAFDHIALEAVECRQGALPKQIRQALLFRDVVYILEVTPKVSFNGVAQVA